MKAFLNEHFGTTKVQDVPLDNLKEKLEGPALIERINHRKSVAINYKREAVAKYAIIRRENVRADAISDVQKNAEFGFSCLHYSVSEAAGVLKIKILNKSGREGSVWVRTVDGDAEDGKDYRAIN